MGVDQDSVNSTLDSISGIIHDMVTPMILPEIYSNRLNNKTIVVIRIFPGATTPYYIKSYGKIRGTFIRVGKTNIQADEGRINELERQRINLSFDEDTSYESSELDIDELCKLLSVHMNKEIDKEQLYNLKLIKIYGEIEYFTNAALNRSRLLNQLQVANHSQVVNQLQVVNQPRLPNQLQVVSQPWLTNVMNINQ